MDRVRVVVQTADPVGEERTIPAYEVVVAVINEWWNQFFNKSIETLLSEVNAFLESHKGSPFPVIVHVMPPQDEADAIPFIKALKGVGVPFIDKKIHHIQQDSMILFHTSPPPSDVPRVLTYTHCYDDVDLFHRFVDDILGILFSFGITLYSGFIKDAESIYFNRFHSFSYLLTLIKQSLFLHFQSCQHTDWRSIFASDPSDIICGFLTKAAHSKALPTQMMIKIRSTIHELYKVLAGKFGTSKYMFADAESIELVWASNNMKRLIRLIDDISPETMKEFIVEKAPLLKPLFDGTHVEQASPVSVKSRRGRALALASQNAGGIRPANILEKIISKAFVELPDDHVCQVDMTDTAMFDPTRTMRTMLSDEDSSNDTVVAYQLLQEQDKVVSASAWLSAFQAKQGIEDKAMALAKFQVAVSELEYLGYVDKNTRKSGTFRRVVRV